MSIPSHSMTNGSVPTACVGFSSASIRWERADVAEILHQQSDTEAVGSPDAIHARFRCLVRQHQQKYLIYSYSLV
jgi:hypothetical protein